MQGRGIARGSYNKTFQWLQKLLADNNFLFYSKKQIKYTSFFLSLSLGSPWLKFSASCGRGVTTDMKKGTEIVSTEKDERER